MIACGSTRLRAMFALLALGVALGACAPAPPPTVPLVQAEARVLESLRVFRTSAAPEPAPTILYVHGASDKSWNPEYQRWVTRLNDAGFSVVFLDLYSGRGANGPAARSGHLLPKETAADLMIALNWTREQEWADTGRIFAMGNSFGGATIMDAMVYDAPGKVPLGLATAPPNGLNGLAKAVLLVPLCKDDVMGFNIVASVHEDFASDIPTLAILAANDSVSDPDLCQAIFARNNAAGKSITVDVVPGAGHTFMSSEDDYGQRFPDYDQDAAEAAWARAISFLKG
jgi:dienelactone hydrolase